MALKATRNWHNEDAYGLEQLKPEMLRHLGRREDALALVWGDFEANPSEFAYEQLMRYVPKGGKAAWHDGPWQPRRRPASATSSPCA
jgi:hypothetical protein